MRSSRDLVKLALTSPNHLIGLTPAEWSRLVYLGRSAAILARISADLRARGVFEKLPEAIRNNLVSAEQGAAQSQTRIRFEIDRMKRALYGRGTRIILLKGAAYIAAGLPNAAGRPSSDIDILVSRADLTLVEAVLLDNGWKSMTKSGYDDQYYRQWMHEVPPLQHPDRAISIDLHHAILPLTSRLQPDPAKLLANSRIIDGNIAILGNTDLVLHSAVHLFQDGSISHTIRDLLDQRDMMRHFAAEDATFWDRLLDRAEELGLTRPLYYSIRYGERILDLEVPESIRSRIRSFAPVAPVRLLMDVLVESAIFPSFLFETNHFHTISDFLLYIRSHWLRMPPLMLARHLFIKALQRLGLKSAR